MNRLFFVQSQKLRCRNTIKATTIFLDEIHYVNDWEATLKRYYDQKGIKFIISGSESIAISKAKATLAGRLVTFQLNQMTFRGISCDERESRGTGRCSP